MSDANRQSMTDKAGAAIKPDSQKGYVESATDAVKGTADSIASTVMPESQKSTTQKAGDAVSGNSNENADSMSNKATGAAQGVIDSAKDVTGMKK